MTSIIFGMLTGHMLYNFGKEKRWYDFCLVVFLFAAFLIHPLEIEYRRSTQTQQDSHD